MPINQQPGRHYVPRRQPKKPVKVEEPKYKCFDFVMTKSEVISSHLARIASKCALDATKAQINALLKYSGDCKIEFVAKADNFYYQHVSAFDQLLASSYDYLCLNAFRDPDFIAQLAASTHWLSRYKQAHTWLLSLFDNVAVDPVVDKEAETDDEKEKQTIWLKFRLFVNAFKKSNPVDALSMWAGLEKGGLNAVLPVLRTVMQEMSGVQREYMETLFVVRPILFIELFDLLGHESFIYTAIDMINIVFDLPRCFMLDCVDECKDRTGLDMKTLFDKIAEEIQHYILVSSQVKAASSSSSSSSLSSKEYSSSINKMTAADTAMFVSELQRLAKNPAMVKKRLTKWVENEKTLGHTLWKVLQPKADQLGFTWEKLQSGIGNNWIDVIAPRLQSLIRSYKQSQKPEDQSRFAQMMSQMKEGISKFTTEQAEEMGMDADRREETQKKVDEFLGRI